MNSLQDSRGIGEATFQRLREDIIFGLLKPNEKLKLDTLKKKYGASVTTLRECLNRLASECLVIAEGQRGFRVAPMSERDLHELAEIRLLLESHAMRKSFENGDLEWEGKVVEAHYKLTQMEQGMLLKSDKDPEFWRDYDANFHQALMSACGSINLISMHKNVFEKYLRYQVRTMRNRGEWSIDEHNALKECALKRDIDGAIQLLNRHIENGIENALSSGLLK